MRSKLIKSLIFTLCITLLCLTSELGVHGEEGRVEPDRIIALEKDGKYGFYDMRKEKFIIEPQYEQADDFSEGLAAVRIDGEWGYINAKNELVIAPRFDNSGYFKRGRAFVKIGKDRVFIDYSGKVDEEYTQKSKQQRKDALYKEFSLQKGEVITRKWLKSLTIRTRGHFFMIVKDEFQNITQRITT